MRSHFLASVVAFTTLTGAITGISSAALAATTAASPARNYDCSKPGNASKAVCKTVAKPAAAAVAPRPMAVATAKPAARMMTYDCSKPGNANKQACKGAPGAAVAAAAGPTHPAAAVKPAAPSIFGARPAKTAAPSNKTVAWTTKTGKTVHYDCSKMGNASKTACK